MRNKIISLLTIAIGIVVQLICVYNLPMIKGLVSLFVAFLSTSTVTILFTKSKDFNCSVELHIITTAISAVYVALSFLVATMYTVAIFTVYPIIAEATEPATAIVKEHIWTSESEYLIVEHSDGIRATLKVHDLPAYMTGDMIAIRYNPQDPCSICSDIITTNSPLSMLCTKAGNPRLIASLEKNIQ